MVYEQYKVELRVLSYGWCRDCLVTLCDIITCNVISALYCYQSVLCLTMLRSFVKFNVIVFLEIS